MHKCHQKKLKLNTLCLKENDILLTHQIIELCLNLYPATKKNYVGKDSYGNTRYAKIVDGKQVWVSVRNGIIQDGGINEKPFKKLYDKKGEFKK